MIIDLPCVDWLTFTTWDQSVFIDWQKWLHNFDGEEKAGKIRMYDGIWRGSAFVGEGTQGNKRHGLIRVSGSESNQAFNQLNKEFSKCTRLDVQVTTPLPSDYSARQFADDLRAGQIGEYKRSITLMENDDGSDTVYVGSIKSDRFARFYVKQDDELKFLRFEIEHKSNWAEIASISLLAGEATLAGILLDFLSTIEFDDSQGVLRMFTDLCNSVKAGLNVPYAVRDKNKTMIWIMDQVTPAMVRLLNDHELGIYLANHLSSLVESYFNKSD